MDVLGTLFVLGLTFVVGFMFTAVAVSVLALVVGLFVRGGHFPAKTVFTLSIVLALGQTIVSGVELFREQLDSGKVRDLAGIVVDVSSGGVSADALSHRVAALNLDDASYDVREAAFGSLLYRQSLTADLWQSYLRGQVVRTPVLVVGSAAEAMHREADERWSDALASAASTGGVELDGVVWRDDDLFGMHAMAQWTFLTVTDEIEEVYGYRVPRTVAQDAFPGAFDWVGTTMGLGQVEAAGPGFASMIEAVSAYVDGVGDVQDFEDLHEAHGEVSLAYAGFLYGQLIIDAVSMVAVGDAVLNGGNVDLPSINAFRRYLGLQEILEMDVIEARETGFFPIFMTAPEAYEVTGTTVERIEAYRDALLVDVARLERSFGDVLPEFSLYLPHVN